MTVPVLLDPRLRLLFFALWCAGWVGTVALSLTPRLPLALHADDWTLHVLGYAGMTALAVSFCHRPLPLALLAAFSAGVGSLLEFGQRFVPGRSMTVDDAVANGLGAACGYALALLTLALLRAAARGRRIA